MGAAGRFLWMVFEAGKLLLSIAELFEVGRKNTWREHSSGLSLRIGGCGTPQKKMASHSMAAINGGDPKHVLFHWDDPPRYPAVGVSKLKPLVHMEVEIYLDLLSVFVGTTTPLPVTVTTRILRILGSGIAT